MAMRIVGREFNGILCCFGGKYIYVANPYQWSSIIRIFFYAKMYSLRIHCTTYVSTPLRNGILRYEIVTEWTQWI